MQFAPTDSRPRGTASLPLMLPVVLLGLLALTGCGNAPAPTPESSQSRTPSGTSAPRTALPMPPASSARVVSAHGNSPASTAATADNTYGFTLLDNRRMKLSDYAGQVVVLDFYATWCPPCRAETPHLVQLQRRYGSQGLRIIGLNVGGPEDRDKVPGFIEEYGIQYALGFPDPGMTDLYLSDNDSIPQAYVFDRKGKLVKRFISYDETVPAEMESVIKKALAE